MKKSFTYIAAGLGAIAATGIFFTNKIMYIKKKPDKEIYEREVSLGRFHPDEFNALPKEEITVSSPFGYDLKGWLIEKFPTNKYIIICHGVTMNKVNSIKYMKLFINRGWNVLMYDHRRHGESGGKTTSYGYYEKHDLKAMVDWLKRRIGNGLVFGIHGESMGAVTMLLYAGEIEDSAAFYIADCPFSDLEEQLAYRLKVDYHLPKSIMMPIANAVLKLREGYQFKDVSPISVIQNIQKPVLFIHSAKDDYILPEMTKKLYKKKSGPKKIYLAPNGAHALSFAENKTEYEEVVDDFLRNLRL